MHPYMRVPNFEKTRFMIFEDMRVMKNNSHINYNYRNLFVSLKQIVPFISLAKKISNN